MNNVIMLVFAFCIAKFIICLLQFDPYIYFGPNQYSTTINILVTVLYHTAKLENKHLIS